jgi:hypothetical protein
MAQFPPGSPLKSDNTSEALRLMAEYDGFTANALNDDLIPMVDVSTFREAVLQITGTFVGTITFQCSIDGVSWVSLAAVPVAGGAIVTTATGVGIFLIPLSTKYLRVRMTAFASGIAIGIIRFSSIALSALFINSTINIGSGSVTATISGTVTTAGTVAHDTADSGNPVKIGGKAYTTDPTAVTTGDRADIYVDTLGKQVMVPLASRLMIATGAMITLTTTTETTILAAAGAGIFLDLSWIILTNTSATGVRIDFRSASAGAVVMSINLAAAETNIFDLSDLPFLQTTANSNWTAQLSAAVTDVRITACAAKRAA